MRSRNSSPTIMISKLPVRPMEPVWKQAGQPRPRCRSPLATRHSPLAIDKKSIGRRQGNPERLPRRRPDRCLCMDGLARTSGRSPAHQLIQHPVKSEFELFRCFVTSGCDLPTNLLHFLVADLRQLANAVEHLSQGGNLDMIARGARMYSLTGIHAKCSQSRVNGLRALCSPCTENFHWASQNGALTDGSTYGSSGCCSIDNPRSLREIVSRLTTVGSPTPVSVHALTSGCGRP